jgi:hypothetical protein
MKPRLETTVGSLDAVVGVPVGAMPRRWEQLIEHRWAVSASPRADTNTSITWPNWSIARVDVAPSAGDLHIGLVHLPSVPNGVAAWFGGVGQ